MRSTSPSTPSCRRGRTRESLCLILTMHIAGVCLEAWHHTVQRLVKHFFLASIHIDAQVPHDTESCRIVRYVLWLLTIAEDPGLRTSVLSTGRVDAIATAPQERYVAAGMVQVIISKQGEQDSRCTAKRTLCACCSTPCPDYLS